MAQLIRILGNIFKIFSVDTVVFLKVKEANNWIGLPFHVKLREIKPKAYLSMALKPRHNLLSGEVTTEIHLDVKIWDLSLKVSSQNSSVKTLAKEDEFWREIIFISKF